MRERGEGRKEGRERERETLRERAERNNVDPFSHHSQGVERFALHSGYGYTLKFDKEYVDDAQVRETNIHCACCYGRFYLAVWVVSLE